MIDTNSVSHLLVLFCCETSHEYILDFKSLIEYTDDVRLYVRHHCLHKSSSLIVQLQFVVDSRIVECDQSAFLLVKINMCSFDDQMKVFLRFVRLLAIAILAQDA